MKLALIEHHLIFSDAICMHCVNLPKENIALSWSYILLCLKRTATKVTVLQMCYVARNVLTGVHLNKDEVFRTCVKLLATIKPV